MSELVLHVLPPSHPCAAVEAALKVKGLEYDKVDLQPGQHVEAMAEIYGEGRTTVPGLMLDDEPIHGSNPIMEALERLAPEPSLYPEDRAEKVREAAAWGDGHLQDLGRRLPWGALHFRPEAMGTFAGGPPLDPAGTDFAMRYVRASWKYHGITCERLAADLASVPEQLDRIDAYISDGILLSGDTPTAADLQIGASLSVIMTVRDIRTLIDAHPAAEVATRWFPENPGNVPVGAFPSGWVPPA